jgi:4-hydroxy-tetrahydrodipicolinate reductase
MKNIKYGIIGSSGKMGKEIISVMNELGHELVFKHDVDENWESGTPKVMIDFSSPSAIEKSLGFATEFESSIIIGTTGFTDEQLKEIKETSKQIAIVQSYNYSLGIFLLLKCAELLNNSLKDWDVEITETHHRFKKDKPSGTAIMIKNILKRDVNISSLRLGNIAGEHTVSFGGLGEVLSVSHLATSRRTFAEGVAKAADFILDKKKGFYTIQDVFSTN